MNEFQKSVDRLYKTKHNKYPREITDKLNDMLLGEALREALIEKEFF